MQNKTVMIADDEQRIRKLISDFLQREGYTIVEADNGQSALTLLAAEKIDLVILDVMMPDPDGLTVCREIRKKKLRADHYADRPQRRTGSTICFRAGRG